MPKQGQSVETCIITKWFRKKGDKVSIGDILFSYETDKASFDLESTVEGILLDVFFEDGAEVPVLVNVAVIGKPGEATDSFNPDKGTLASHAASIASNTSADAEALNAVKPLKIPEGQDNKIRISPRARRIAENKGLNYNNLQGSGPNGRIITRDIERVHSGEDVVSKIIQTTVAEFTELPLSNVRKIIARTMHSSLQNSAQLTHHMSADVRFLLEARQRIKNRLSTDKNQQDITLNDMVCWCVIKALEKFPEANSHFLDDRIKTFHKVHLGLAVDTPRGLMVPAVKNAGEMDLAKLSKELKSVAEACKKGNINPELIQSTARYFYCIKFRKLWS